MENREKETCNINKASTSESVNCQPNSHTQSEEENVRGYA